MGKLVACGSAVALWFSQSWILLAEGQLVYRLPRPVG